MLAVAIKFGLTYKLCIFPKVPAFLIRGMNQLTRGIESVVVVIVV